MSTMRLSLIVEAIDHLTAPVRRMQQQLDRLGEPVRALGRMADAGGIGRLRTAVDGIAGGFGRAYDQAGALLGRTALLGAGLGWFFKSQFVDTAAEFERLGIVLEVVEGSAAAAERSMDWISSFSTRTPFELVEVTQAFVDLRNLGIDPMNGSLGAAGDAAAAMGTTFVDSVGALSGALRGEFDQLERFGVFARVEGENLVLNWEEHGQRMRAVADKTNRDLIAAIIQQAWNAKYAGAMDRLSDSWDGVMSNLSDAWARWTLAVMDSGVFDWMSSRLQGLLDLANRMAADGTLQRWADDVADRIIRAFEATERFLFGFWLIGDSLAEAQYVPGLFARIGDMIDRVAALMAPVTERFGTFETIVAAIALVVAGPLLAAIASLTTAFITLGVAMMATPVGWFMGAVALIAGAAYAIYANWDGVVGYFTDVWSNVVRVFEGAWGYFEDVGENFGRVAMRLMEAWTPITGYFTDVWNNVTRVFEDAWGLIEGVVEKISGAVDLVRSAGQFLGLVDDPATGAASTGPYGLPLDPAGAAPGPIAGRQSVDAGGTLRIQVDGPAWIARAQANDPSRFNFDIDRGRLVDAY